MANRRMAMYEYQQIIYRLRLGQAQREISRSGLASRCKVREIAKIASSLGWLDPNTALPESEAIAEVFKPKNRIHSSESKLQVYKELVDPWIEDGIQATVIYQHLIKNHQFSGSYNAVQRYVRKKRSNNQQNLTVPLNFKPGEAVQVDFGKGPDLLDLRTARVEQTWFFVMTLCFSRHQYVELVTHQDIHTWLTCHQNAFNWFGGVTEKVIIDNPKCAITKASTTDPQIQRSYEALAQEYGFVISPCPPADPQKKGRVESGVKYVKRSFVPLRSIKSLQDGNKQLKQWVLEVAGSRSHGTTRKQPLESFTQLEKPTLKPLPIEPVDICVWKKVKLYRDCHIRVDHCRYSAPHKYVNNDLWAKISATTVSIYLDHQLLTTHAKAFDPDKPMTKIEHLPPKAKAFFEQDATWCHKEAETIGINCTTVIELMLSDPIRDLLRSAQSVIRLSKKFGKARLEQACKRALLFNAVSEPTIKQILQKGLDYQSLSIQQSFDELGQAYKGHATYQRSINNNKH